MPWLLKQKKKKKEKEKKRYKFSTRNIAKLKLWHKVKCHQAQQREKSCWEHKMFAEDEGDVYNNVWMSVDFVLNFCGFIFFFSSIYIQMTLKFYFFAVRMSLHKPCLVWKV